MYIFFRKLHGIPKSSGHGVKALVVDCVTALATTGFVCRLLRGEVGAFTWFQDESSATSWTKSINVAATISWVIGTSSTAAKRISCCWLLWISPLFCESIELFQWILSEWKVSGWWCNSILNWAYHKGDFEGNYASQKCKIERKSCQFLLNGAKNMRKCTLCSYIITVFFKVKAMPTVFEKHPEKYHFAITIRS